METVGKKMASNEKTEMFMEEEKLKDFCSSESLPGLPLHRFKSCIIFGNGGEIGLLKDSVGNEVVQTSKLEDEGPQGASYFYCTSEKFFEPVHQYYLKKTKSICRLTTPDHKMKQLVGVKQDYSLELRLKINKKDKDKCVVYHFTIFPIEPMSPEEFESILETFVSQSPCSFQLKGSGYDINSLDDQVEDDPYPRDAVIAQACAVLCECYKQTSFGSANDSFAFWFFSRYLRIPENVKSREVIYGKHVLGRTLCRALEICSDGRNCHIEILRDQMREKLAEIFDHNPIFRSAET